MHAASPQRAAAAGGLPHPSEYLCFFRGFPWSRPWKRIDALCRVARGALGLGRTCYFLFEDCSLLRLEPALLDEWPLHALEDSLKGILDRVVAQAKDARASDGWAGAEAPGVRFWRPEGSGGRSLQRAVERVLQEEPGAARYDLVIGFREDGAPLLRLMMGERQARAEVAPGFPGRVLVFLGGVRDVYEKEEEAVQEACARLGIANRLVALGRYAELTSKLIKAFEAMNDAGYLSRGLDRCEAAGWPRNEASEAHAPPRPPLHFIVLLSTELSSFVAHPGAANLLVDTFKGSHSNYRGAAMSLLDSDGRGVTLTRDGPSTLGQADALAYIQEQADRAEEDRKRLGRAGRPLLAEVIRRVHGNGRLMLLHADDRAGLLRPAQDPAGDVPQVAVVWAAEGRAREVTEAARSAQVTYARAHVGGILEGPSLVSLLHGEGLLAGAILAASSPLARPSGPGQQQVCPPSRPLTVRALPQGAAQGTVTPGRSFAEMARGATAQPAPAAPPALAAAPSPAPAAGKGHGKGQPHSQAGPGLRAPKAGAPDALASLGHLGSCLPDEQEGATKGSSDAVLEKAEVPLRAATAVEPARAQGEPTVPQQRQRPLADPATQVNGESEAVQMPQKAAWATPKPGRRAAWADIAEEDADEDDVLDAVQHTSVDAAVGMTPADRPATPRSSADAGPEGAEELGLQQAPGPEPEAKPEASPAPAARPPQPKSYATWADMARKGAKPEAAEAAKKAEEEPLAAEAAEAAEAADVAKKAEEERQAAEAAEAAKKAEQERLAAKAVEAAKKAEKEPLASEAAEAAKKAEEETPAVGAAAPAAASPPGGASPPAATLVAAAAPGNVAAEGADAEEKATEAVGSLPSSEEPEANGHPRGNATAAGARRSWADIARAQAQERTPAQAS